jgi:hypothetical protein
MSVAINAELNIVDFYNQFVRILCHQSYEEYLYIDIEGMENFCDKQGTARIT